MPQLGKEFYRRRVLQVAESAVFAAYKSDGCRLVGYAQAALCYSRQFHFRSGSEKMRQRLTCANY
jgi:hypothetical protein